MDAFFVPAVLLAVLLGLLVWWTETGRFVLWFAAIVGFLALNVIVLSFLCHGDRPSRRSPLGWRADYFPDDVGPDAPRPATLASQADNFGGGKGDATAGGRAGDGSRSSGPACAGNCPTWPIDWARAFRSAPRLRWPVEHCRRKPSWRLKWAKRPVICLAP